VDGELTPQPDEVMDAKWFSLKEVEEMLAHGKIRDIWAVESIRKVENAHNRD
jgi:isopentenyldiphosphate isomerase